MKGLICFFTALIIFTTPITAFAADNEYKGEDFDVSFPENYIVLDQNNLSKNDEFINSIDNHSVESFRRTMKESNMLVFSAPKDNSEQIQFYKWNDTISDTIYSLKSLNDELFKTTANSIEQIITKDKNAKITLTEKIETGDLTFIKYILFYQDEKSSYGSIQYLTISEGNFYSLNYYNKEGQITDSQNAVAEQVFSTLDIDVKKAVNFTYYLLRVGGIILIICAIIVLILIIKSICADIRKNKNADEKIPDKIKMNRKRRR